MSISTIKISGGYFNSQKEFKLFHNHKQVATVIYGKNGSGKSSISRAFQEVFNSEPTKEKEFSSIEFYKLKAHPSQGIELIDTSKISIPCYVHNEEFTHDTVSFNDSGLGTIVMFGEQLDIKKDLEALEEDLKKSEEKYNTTIEKVEKMSNPNNIDSHFNIKEQIKNKLRQLWSVRHQNINDLKTLGRVDTNLFGELMNFESINDSYENLFTVFENTYSKYLKLKSATPIKDVEPLLLDINIEKLVNLLKSELQQPHLSEKEQKILEVYKSLDNKKTTDANIFLNNSDNTCPICFQNVDIDHKSMVLETIGKILNTEAANNLKNTLNQIEVKYYKIDVSSIETIVDDKIINNLKTHIESYNEFIKRLESEQNNKKNNPYSPIRIDFDINHLVNIINECIKTVNLEVKKFNKQITIKKTIADELKDINKKLAYLECKELLNLYKEKNKLFLEAKADKISGNKEINNIQGKIDKKQASLENVEIALELINNYLRYIFYDENRLYLEPSKDSYKVMSRGKPVKPSSLSIGEKNIISLCYFFSTLFQNKSMEDLFKNECLLILDDPLSSFDFENKVGVYSFLRYILNELHYGNEKSKSVIFSHDLDVLYNMAKVYSDLNITDKNKGLKLFYLDSQELDVVKQENFDEYSTLIQSAFDFIIDSSTNDLNIGNNLRRILEAFATFNYKCSVEELTRHPDILSKLPSEVHFYFKNSMYRLILNTESHLKERSRQLLTSSFKEHFSIEEKKRTAKDILMFLYYLDIVHLKFHLKKEKTEDVSLKIKQIEDWTQEINSNSENLMI
ncbi:AAA family ATPase [Oceanobacillus damuensis]|uniref:AAA family ATPase n=1 Tax=Oceanobacillus damuensis TaxID=937928 RepID=UPI0008307191|nr:AAA family ATPase [Oceanobacillus damuensis]